MTGVTSESNGHGKSNRIYATPSPTQLEGPQPLKTNIVANHYEVSQGMDPAASYEHPYEMEPAEPAYQDPEYAQPSVSRRATPSQPYEVPMSALSTLLVRIHLCLLFHSFPNKHVFSSFEVSCSSFHVLE